MSRDKTIKVHINADGSCSIDAQNFHGKGCTSAIDEILSDLGATDVKRTDKPEIRQPQSARERGKESSR